MATGLQVTLPIPDGALPGMLLSVPVRGGAENVEIRVPDGVGPGSEIVLLKAEGRDDWEVQVASVVPPVGAPPSEPAPPPQPPAPEASGGPNPGTALQVTLPIPDGALPGTLLSVPVRGGAETVTIRVPDGVGPGSEIMLIKAEGAEDWEVKVVSVVPPAGEVADVSGIQNQAASAGPPAGECADISGIEHQVEEPAPSIGGDGALAYTVRLETTVGAIDIIVRPDWAPYGTQRFLELAAAGDLNDLAFYRAIRGCIVQFGLPPKRLWPPVPDDPPKGVPFLLGAVSFAAVGENSRKSTLFICIGDMSHCLGEHSWETPIGAVAEASLDVLDRIETRYGDIAEFNGPGPDTTRINSEGAPYLRENFPALTYITRAYPLDWQPPPDMPLPPPNQVPRPPPSPAGANDPAALAARAAEDAQLKAAQAAQAAAMAQQCHIPEQMVQAAQAAREAAEAAQAAAQQATQAAERAEAAQAAQAAQVEKAARAEQAAQAALRAQQQQVEELQLREREQRQRLEAREREDAIARSIRPSSGFSSDVKYIQPSEQVDISCGGGSFRSPVDVPVEIRKGASWVPPPNGPAAVSSWNMPASGAFGQAPVGRPAAASLATPVNAGAGLSGGSMVFRSGCNAPPYVGGASPGPALRSAAQTSVAPPMVGTQPLAGTAIGLTNANPSYRPPGYMNPSALQNVPTQHSLASSQGVSLNVGASLLRR